MLILLFLLFAILPRNAYAGNDINITCGSQGCITSPSLPLFAESRTYPGYFVNQNLVVLNNNSDACRLELDTTGSVDNHVLADAINIKINQGQNQYFEGSLRRLIDTNPDLGIIPVNASITYLWTLKLSNDLDNSYQNLSANFDLNFNFSCEETQITPTNTPPPPTNTPTPVTNLTLVVNELMPNAGTEWVEIYNPNDVSVDVNAWKIKRSDGDSKTINTSISAHSYYVFEFGSGFLSNSSGYIRLFDNQNNQVSQSDTYSSTSSGISWSRQSNGWCDANPSPNSTNNECLESANTTNSQVMGVSTTSSSPPSDQNAELTGNVMGDTISNTCTYYWLPILFLVSIFLNNLLIRRNLGFRLAILMFFISSVFFFIDYYLRTINCCYKSLLICRYYWIGHIISFILPLIIKIVATIKPYGQHDPSKLQK